jgi:hypothetical protein
MPEEEKFQADSEVSALESMKDADNAKNDITKTYKLFNYVC